MEVVKPKVMEKYEFEDRDMSKLIALLAGCELSVFHPKKKRSSSSRELSIELLMLKFKLVVLDNYEFDNRDL